MYSRFGILFLVTGFLALIGALYTWGRGPIWTAEPVFALIPLADLLLAAPASVVAGIALLLKKSWALRWTLLVSGMYVYGSILVWLLLLLFPHYRSPELWIAPVWGLLLAIYFYAKSPSML